MANILATGCEIIPKFYISFPQCNVHGKTQKSMCILVFWYYIVDKDLLPKHLSYSDCFLVP